MMSFSHLWLVLPLLWVEIAIAQTGYIPRNGFVPDKATAVKVAEAILVPIYGEDVLKQRPFKATLNGDSWTVEGSVHEIKGEVVVGGVASIVIRKSTGEIVSVIHGK